MQDAASQEALSDVRLRIREHQKTKLIAETATDSLGFFSFSDLEEGLYDIECQTQRYIGQRLIGYAIKEGRSHSYTFQLTRGGYAGETEELYSHASLQAQLQRKVTTASLFSDAQIDAPATIYVVTAEQIAQRGYTSLLELLEDIPEVEIQDRSNYYTYNMIGIRGVPGGKRFILLLDGVRISSFTAADLTYDRNISVLQAEQVEVLLGPAAALYGSDAVTGVINIITPKSKQNQVQAMTSYGRFHTTENSLSLSLHKGNFSLFASGSLYASQEPELPKYYRSDFDWYWNRYQADGAMHTFGDTTALTYLPIRPYSTPRHAYWVNAKMQYKGWELGFQRNMQGFNAAVSMQPGLAVAWKEYTTYSSLTNVYLGHHKQAKRWSLQSLLNWNWFEVSPRTRFADSYNEYQTIYNYTFNHTWQHNELFSYLLHERHQLQAGLTTSFTYELPNGMRSFVLPWQRGKGQDILPLQYYPGTQTTWEDGRDTQIVQNIRYTYQLNGGVFLQYKGNILDRLYITAGLRFDYILRPENRYPNFNPRLGLVYKPHRNWSLKLFYGESFIAPSIEALYSDFTSILPVTDSLSGLSTGYTSGYAFMPNPELRPEKMRTAELGLVFARNNLVLSANGYFNYLSNAIAVQAFLDSSYLNIPTAYVEQNTNAGDLMSYGATAQIAYRLPLGKKQGKNELQFRAAYSFSAGRTTDIDGNVSTLLPYSAPHTLRAGILFRYAGFCLDLRALYRSRSYDGGIYDEQGEFVYRYNKAFVVLHATASYRLLEADKRRPWLELFVKVRNLTDARHYHLSINYSDTFFAAPQDPLRITGGLRMGFGGNRRQEGI